MLDRPMDPATLRAWLALLTIASVANTSTLLILLLR